MDDVLGFHFDVMIESDHIDISIVIELIILTDALHSKAESCALVSSESNLGLETTMFIGVPAEHLGLLK